jgi:hypothetical protein
MGPVPGLDVEQEVTHPSLYFIEKYHIRWDFIPGLIPGFAILICTGAA